MFPSSCLAASNKFKSQQEEPQRAFASLITNLTAHAQLKVTGKSHRIAPKHDPKPYKSAKVQGYKEVKVKPVQDPTTDPSQTTRKERAKNERTDADMYGIRDRESEYNDYGYDTGRAAWSGFEMGQCSDDERGRR